MNNFEKAFDRVIGHEGGYTSDTKDRANWTSGICGQGECKGTKYGLSAMTYPTLDIYNITVEQAKAIYKRDWWDKLGMDKYHPALAYQMFDASINHGATTANKFLQKAVGVTADGIVGTKTLAAIKSKDIKDVLTLFLATRLQYFTEISTWKTYCTGWSRRVVQNMMYAVEDTK